MSVCSTCLSSENSAIEAAEDGHIDCLKSIIETSPHLLSEVDDGGNTAAAKAALLHADCFKLIAEAAPETLKKVNNNGTSVAHTTAFNCVLDSLKVIIDIAPGFLVSKDRHSGNTPAHVACLMDGDRPEPRSPGFVRMIAEHSPEALSIQDNDGKTPAMIAVINELDETLRVIAEKAPESLKIADNDGTKPLRVARAKGNAKCVKIITDAIGDVDGTIKKTPFKKLKKIIKERMQTDSAFQNNYLCGPEWVENVKKNFNSTTRFAILKGLLQGSGCLTIPLVIVMLFIFPPVVTIIVALIAFVALYILMKKSNNEKISLSGQFFAEEIEQLDYYYMQPRNNFGVNIESRMVCVSTNQKNVNHGNTITLHSDLITGMRISQPGHTTYSSNASHYGTDLTSAMQASSANSAARSEAARKTRASQQAALAQTGLFLSTDDMNLPEIFVNMAYEEAEKWMLLLQKLNKGELEKQKEPVLFPSND